MLLQLLAGIIFDALILMGALRLLAKHESDSSFAKCALVAAPLTVVRAALTVLLIQWVGPKAVFPVVALLMAPVIGFLVARFCWVPWPRAAGVVAVFYVGRILFGIILLVLGGVLAS